MKERRSLSFIILNDAHGQQLEDDPELKELFHKADHEKEDVNLKKGERLLSDPRLILFFDNATTISQKHIIVLDAINQQFLNIHSQLKQAYDMYNRDSFFLPALKKMFDKSVPLFLSLRELNGSVYGYYEAAEDSLKTLGEKPQEEETRVSNAWALFAEFETQHTLFQKNYEGFESYLKDSAEALGVEDPTVPTPPKDDGASDDSKS